MTTRGQQGVALIEALLAAVLLGIGLLGTIGLQARSYSALAQAGMRAEATIAAEKLLGVMATDQGNLAAYALGGDVKEPGPRLLDWYAETRSRIPGASVTISVTPQAGTSRTAVVIVIGWTGKPGEASNVHRVTSYLSPST